MIFTRRGCIHKKGLHLSYFKLDDMQNSLTDAQANDERFQCANVRLGDIIWSSTVLGAGTSFTLESSWVVLPVVRTQALAVMEQALPRRPMLLLETCISSRHGRRVPISAWLELM